MPSPPFVSLLNPQDPQEKLFMDRTSTQDKPPSSGANALSSHGADQNGLVPSHAISVQSGPLSPAKRPPAIRHVSTPTFESPLRHHQRGPSAPRQVKESLDARSEYVTSQDDGTAQHRINQYIIKQEIGRGSFGAVHLAVDQYGIEYAVKEFSKARLRKRAQSHILRKPRIQRTEANKKSSDDFNSPLHRNPQSDPSIAGHKASSIDLIKEEIAIMKKLDHPNLCGLIEVLDDPREDSLYMVMEMCKKGIIMKVGLDQTADPYSAESCRCWFRDLILGIEYLHAQGILHRDIKPDNCLLTHDDILKVVDFGVSEMFEKDSEMLTAKSAGSPAFLPPELCIARHGDVSGRSADIWSMGVTLFCLRYGRIPFEKAGIFELYDAIKTESPDFGEEKDEQFLNMMHKIFEKDPRQRIKMHELREHPWVTNCGADPLLSETENTGKMIEPPTAAEMESAITGNIGNLMTVMKAVKKFKKLTAARRPPIMSSILAEDDSSRFSQPPLELGKDEKPPLPHKSQSMTMFDRETTESALVVEGVHRDLGIGMMLSPEPVDLKNSQGTSSSGTELSSRPKAISSPPPTSGVSRQESDLSWHESQNSVDLDENGDLLPVFRPAGGANRAKTQYETGRRGQARDPLEETLYLYIGPSTFSATGHNADRRATFVPDSEDGDELFVSESPGAADIDIYETAYRDEIERIRKRNLEQGKDPDEATVFLTRRVDERLVAVGKFAGKFLAKGEEGYERFDAITGWRDKKARASDVSRALRNAARQEYEKRRVERRQKEQKEREAAAQLQAEKGDFDKDPIRNLSQEASIAESSVDLIENKPPVYESHKREGSQSWGSLLSQGAKAVEKSKQAKGTIKGFMGKVREKRTWSRDGHDNSSGA